MNREDHKPYLVWPSFVEALSGQELTRNLADKSDLPSYCCSNVAPTSGEFRACREKAVTWYKHGGDICSYCKEHNVTCGEPIDRIEWLTSKNQELLGKILVGSPAKGTLVAWVARLVSAEARLIVASTIADCTGDDTRPLREVLEEQALEPDCEHSVVAALLAAEFLLQRKTFPLPWTVKPPPPKENT